MTAKYNYRDTSLLAYQTNKTQRTGDIEIAAKSHRTDMYMRSVRKLIGAHTNIAKNPKKRKRVTNDNRSTKYKYIANATHISSDLA